MKTTIREMLRNTFKGERREAVVWRQYINMKDIELYWRIFENEHCQLIHGCHAWEVFDEMEFEFEKIGDEYIAQTDNRKVVIKRFEI